MYLCLRDEINEDASENMARKSVTELIAAENEKVADEERELALYESPLMNIDFKQMFNRAVEVFGKEALGGQELDANGREKEIDIKALKVSKMINLNVKMNFDY